MGRELLRGHPVPFNPLGRGKGQGHLDTLRGGSISVHKSPQGPGEES